MVRQSSRKNKLPDFLGNRAFVDFRNDHRFENGFDLLLRDIYGKQRHIKPELGSNPFEKAQIYVKPDLGQPPGYIQSLPSTCDWADDLGKDEYGSWADLNLAGVIQRMRWIEPGSFLMGSPGNEKQREDNERQYRVTLTQGYWLADTACTQNLWLAVMASNPSKFKNDPQNPIEGISWEDSQQFFKRANALIASFQLDLPTEAQWEYAAKLGKSKNKNKINNKNE